MDMSGTLCTLAEMETERGMFYELLAFRFAGQDIASALFGRLATEQKARLSAIQHQARLASTASERGYPLDLDQDLLVQVAGLMDSSLNREAPLGFDEAVEVASDLEARCLDLYRSGEEGSPADIWTPLVAKLRAGCTRHLALLLEHRTYAGSVAPGGATGSVGLPTAELEIVASGDRVVESAGLEDVSGLDDLLRADRELLPGLFEAVHDGIYIVNAERKIVYWNAAATRIVGHEEPEILGCHCWNDRFCQGHTQSAGVCDEDCPLQELMGGGAPRTAQVELRHKAGHPVPVTVTLHPIKTLEGRTLGAVHVFRERPVCEAADDGRGELQRLAYLDSLTGLPNRRYLEQALACRLDELKRYGWGFGVIFIDLDEFKKVNDRLGHLAGDHLLQAVGRTLAANVRLSDVAGRWGGDEFVVLLAGVEAERLGVGARKLKRLVEHGRTLGAGAVVRARASIGAALARPDDSVERLLNRCDELMYTSKRRGGGVVSLDGDQDGIGFGSTADADGKLRTLSRAATAGGAK